jgi:dihydrofolate reductase
MKTVLVFVSTLDGKVTRWHDPLVKRWSSKEDKIYFSKTIHESKLIVMGSNTFNAEPVNPAETRLIIVMTSHPDDYKQREVPGRLEFTGESPLQLVTRFEKEGYEIMHVVGGPKVATAFLKEQLVDELWLTIEPKIFGSGDMLVTEEKIDIQLELISCEKVNEPGTLITKYKILKK